MKSTYEPVSRHTQELMLKFNSLNQSHIKNLQAMVAKDRFSTGESVLDLHAEDQSQHPPSRPEAVIWPVERFEVSNILNTPMTI